MEVLTSKRAAQILQTSCGRIGAVEMKPYVEGPALVKRYLHGDVTLLGRRFRLKQVNPARQDADAVRECCRMANRVHAGLHQHRSDLPVGVPKLHLLEMSLRRDLYVAQLVSGVGVSCDTPGKRQMIVQALLNLEEATRKWGLAPGAKPEWINSCPRQEYRNRLERSLRSVPSVHESTRRSLIDAAVLAFDRYWSPRLQPPVERCFAHGDFSHGNVLARGEALTLIDFEHSHIGAPGLDVAHLYVNLRCVGCADEAGDLKDRYLSARALRTGSRSSLARSLFDALVVERVAGKWNAMKADRTDAHEKIQALLHEAIGWH